MQRAIQIVPEVPLMPSGKMMPRLLEDIDEDRPLIMLEDAGTEPASPSGDHSFAQAVIIASSTRVPCTTQRRFASNRARLHEARTCHAHASPKLRGLR